MFSIYFCLSIKQLKQHSNIFRKFLILGYLKNGTGYKIEYEATKWKYKVTITMQIIIRSICYKCRVTTFKIQFNTI